MNFIENELLIPIKNISLIPLIKKEVEYIQENFTESDYNKINEKLKSLKEFNDTIVEKINKKKESLNELNEKNDAYSTFIHMFDNIQERNETYYKTLMLLITLIFILILSIVSYYIYSRNN